MTTGGDGALLEVTDLSVAFHTREGTVHAVRSISLTVQRGRTLAIVGESGSGKSVTARAVAGLLNPRSARITSGSIRLGGRDLLRLKRSELRQVHSQHIGIVFQDPMRSLNPTMRIHDQVAEAIRASRTATSRSEVRARAEELMTAVRIPDPRRVLNAYPHELSGGMRQRVMLAIALAKNPDLLIADEPTTALDVTVQDQVLRLIDDLRDRYGMGTLLITHNLAVAASHADEVAVMYAGRIVERGPVHAVLRTPRMPYTRGLVGAIPRPDQGVRAILPTIPGRPPVPTALPAGCAFHPRCSRRTERCVEATPQLRSSEGSAHVWACWHPILPEETNGR